MYPMYSLRKVNRPKTCVTIAVYKAIKIYYGLTRVRGPGIFGFRDPFFLLKGKGRLLSAICKDTHPNSCHSVLVLVMAKTKDEADEDEAAWTPDNVAYQASSPDEEALVVGAKGQGISLCSH